MLDKQISVHFKKSIFVYLQGDQIFQCLKDSEISKYHFCELAISLKIVVIIKNSGINPLHSYINGDCTPINI